MSPIGIHILSEQRDLLEATIAQVAHFTENALYVTRTLTATGIGHNAVVAEIVATTHDAHKPADACTMQALRHHVAIGLGGRQFDIDGLMACLSLRNKVGQRQISIRTSYQVAVVIL